MEEIIKHVSAALVTAILILLCWGAAKGLEYVAGADAERVFVVGLGASIWWSALRAMHFMGARK